MQIRPFLETFWINLIITIRSKFQELCGILKNVTTHFFIQFWPILAQPKLILLIILLDAAIPAARHNDTDFIDNLQTGHRIIVRWQHNRNPAIIQIIRHSENSTKKKQNFDYQISIGLTKYSAKNRSNLHGIIP